MDTQRKGTMTSNSTTTYMDSLKSISLDHFLDKDVDLEKFFSKEELDKMTQNERMRFKNIAQNYEIMTYMGLPAIKPDFMKSPAFRSKQTKTVETLNVEEPPEQRGQDSDGSDEEWTPDMERMKQAKAEPKAKIPQFLKPPKRSTYNSDFKEPSAKRPKKTEKKSGDNPKKKKDASEPRDKYNLRDRVPVNFMNLEPPDDDHFLYCEECNKEYDMDCPVHGPLTYITDKEVEDVADADRALRTLPDGLAVKTSSIPGAGLGVFTDVDIQPRVLYGPYGGVNITDSQKAHDSGYCWQIYTDGKPSHFVDAKDKKTSNWMRYVNCANTEQDQNLVAFQYKGAIYYRSFKVIAAGTELLTWYGDEYGRELGSVRDKNLLFRPKYVNGGVCFPCVFCKTAFTEVAYCVRHLVRSHGKDKLTSTDIQELDKWLRTHDEDHYRRIRANTCRKTDKQIKSKIFQKYIYDQKQQYGQSDQQIKANSTCKSNFTFNKLIRKGLNSKPNMKVDKTNKDQTNVNSLKPFRNTRKNGKFLSNVQIHHKKNKETHNKENQHEYDYETNKEMLQTHVRTHTGEKPFKCEECGYAASQRVHLQTHMRTHTGEKPFKCEECGYATSHRWVLQTHMRTHTGEKPFKCEECGYATNQRGALQTHMKTHTGEKPFKCEECGYATSHRWVLQTHMRTHTGEKPFKCEECGYATNQRANLQRHMRTHTGEKPFKCEECGYAASRREVLQTHMRTHTGEKPFKCDE